MFNPNQQQEDDEPSFESLEPAVRRIRQSFASMERRLEKLQKVNDSLSDFNQSFSAFLYGMAVNNSAVEWPEAPTQQSIEDHQERLKSNTTIRNAEVVRAVAVPSTSTANPTQSTNTPNPTINRKRKVPAEKPPQPVANKRRFVSKIVVSKIIDKLPLEFREKTEPRKHMKQTLDVLKEYPSGLVMKDLVTKVGLPQYVVTSCVNALVHSKDVIKQSVEGSYSTIMFDPDRFPSTVNR